LAEIASNQLKDALKEERKEKLELERLRLIISELSSSDDKNLATILNQKILHLELEDQDKMQRQDKLVAKNAELEKSVFEVNIFKIVGAQGQLLA
jgi:hypothetical protein